MKSIQYYCGDYFDPRCGSDITASEWLSKKIEAGKLLVHELVNRHYSERDSVRIARVSKAIDDWTVQLNEINGIEKDIG